MSRRTRSTLRCLREDLRVDLPGPEIDLGDLDDPILAKARGLASAYPLNQERLELVTDRQVYKFPHGRLRVADWLEKPADIVWVLGAGLRHEGSAVDVYVYLAALYESGALWPDEDDYRRDRLEGAVRFTRLLRADAEAAISVATEQPDVEVSFLIAEERIRVQLLVVREGGLEEIWLAVLTPDAEGTYLTDEVKQAVMAAFRLAARDAEWDEPGRWINRPLKWYEVALLGVREVRD